MWRRFSRIGAAAVVVLVMMPGCSKSKNRVSDRHEPRRDRDARSAMDTRTSDYNQEPVRVSEPRDGRRPERRESPPTNRVSLVTDRDASPEEIPGYHISFDELRMHVENQSAIVVDARNPDDFKAGHVRGAINVPAGQVERYTRKRLSDIDRDQLIIIYCSSASCHSSDMVHEYLSGQGFTNLRVYSPGWQVLSHARDLNS